MMIFWNSRSSFVTLILFLFLAGAASAQPPVPVGNIFPVNTTTVQNQEEPVIATDLDGSFVSVWTSDGQDGSGSGIFAQLFDEEGDAVGMEIPVNVTVTGDQADPAVSMSDDEAFAVAWVGPDADGTGIFLRIFDEGVATTLTDIQVNTTTTGMQTDPDVALAEDEQVLVVWQSPDGDGEGVSGRFFDFDGVPLSVEFSIPTTTSGDQTDPACDDVDEDGSFVIAWEGTDAQGRGIFAQRVEDTGTLLGGEIAVNTTTAGDQVDPEIGVRTNDDALEDNGFVITWQGPDTSETGIFAQFFNEDGTPTGVEIQVNIEDLGAQTDPDVSIDDEGDYVITWSDVELEEGSPIVLRGRRIGSSFSLEQTSGTDVFTVTSGLVQSPTIAAEANGDFVVVWQNANDGNGSGIFGQRFVVGAVIFQDGFETGDTASWSAAVP